MTTPAEKNRIMSEKFEEALCLASRLHCKQLRKGTEILYVSHPMAVAATVLEYGGSELEAIAALLHDAIEDGENAAAVREEIRKKFGDWVLSVVEECTDTDEHPKPPWQKRKVGYIAKIAHASPSAHLVSAADKLHNARSILRDHSLVGEEVWERFKGGRDGMIWYLRALTNEYREARKAPKHLIRELDRAVKEMERRREQFIRKAIKKQIAEDLEALKVTIASGEYEKEAKDCREWGGADVIIQDHEDDRIRYFLRNEHEVISLDPYEPRRRAVITGHSRELSWLFFQLGDVFGSRIDCGSKYVFFGLLAQAALDHLEKNGEGKDAKPMLLEVLEASKEFR